MIKRILVALDPDEDTPLATRYAIELAKSTGASITGLAPVDTTKIASEVGGTAIGPAYYAEDLHKQMTEDSMEKAGELLETFSGKVSKEGLRDIPVTAEGMPHERIAEEMKYHDLLVIGRDSHFFYNRPEEDTHTLAKLLKIATGPSVVITDSYRKVRKVVIAHDGGGACARALQWFVQLEPFGKDLEIHVVHVCDLENEVIADRSKLLLRLVSTYLKSHNFKNIVTRLLDKGTPGERIIDYVRETGSDMIILGAHSMSAIRRMTLGSTTYDLVENSPVPLFISQ